MILARILLKGERTKKPVSPQVLLCVQMDFGNRIVITPLALWHIIHITLSMAT